MEPLTVLLLLLGSCLVCVVAGGSVAKEKNRDAAEGVLFGAVFGPIGILITAMLPTKPSRDQPGQADVGTIGQRKPRSQEDRGRIFYLEDRYPDILEEVAPDWRKASYHRRKVVLRNYDKRLMKERKLSRTQFDELSIEAMRPILNEH